LGDPSRDMLTEDIGSSSQTLLVAWNKRDSVTVQACTLTIVVVTVVFFFGVCVFIWLPCVLLKIEIRKGKCALTFIVSVR